MCQTVQSILAIAGQQHDVSSNPFFPQMGWITGFPMIRVVTTHDLLCYVLCTYNTHTHVYIYVYNIQICTQWYMNTAYDAWIRIVGVSIICIIPLPPPVARTHGYADCIAPSSAVQERLSGASAWVAIMKFNKAQEIFDLNSEPTCIIYIYIDHIYIFSYGITSKHQHVLPQLFIGPFDFKIHPKKNCRTKQKQTHRHTKSSLDVETPRHLHPAPTPTASFVNLSRSIAQFVGEFPLPSVMGVPPSIRDGKITTKTQEIWTWLSPESKPVWEKGSFLVLLGGWMHQVQTSYVIELRSLLVKHITTNSTASTI